MRHKTSPAVVGAFVLGATLLGLSAIVLLGAKDLFRETYPFVSYFQSSVNGLHEGAPVKFKGVEIGKVTQINLPLSKRPIDPPVIVFFSLDARKLRPAGEHELTTEDMQDAIQAGLRVRLEQESFVTGLLYLSLAFVPDSEVKLHAPTEGIPEIPTAPSEFEQLTGQIRRLVDRLEDVDMVALVDHVRETFQSVGEVFRSDGLQETLTSLDETLDSVHDAAQVVSQEIGPLVASLRVAGERVDAVGIDLQMSSAQARETLGKIESLVGSLEGSVKELSRSVDATLAMARGAIDPTAPPLARLEQTLVDLSATARAARAVLEILERDPAALVRGKGIPEEPR